MTDNFFGRCDHSWLWRLLNPERVKIWQKAYHAANREDRRAKSRAWAAAHREHAREKSKVWQKANGERSNARERADRAINPEKYRTAELRRRHATPGREAERTAARRTRTLKATPPWVDRDAIRKIYAAAAFLGLQVDHIHPLKGKNFCGLHVPWNLQLLTPRENARKGNKLLLGDI